MVVIVAVVVTSKKDDEKEIVKYEFAKAAVATDRAVSDRSSND